MKPALRRMFGIAAVLLVALPRDAHADPLVPPPPAATSPPPLHWGWALAIGSVAAGATLTVVSLTLRCPHDDIECARWTSFGIWGGIGVASVGAAAGLIGVTNDARRARLRVSVAVDRTPRAVLVYTF